MNATQELETKLVPFMGADLMAAKDNDGQVWAAVRWMCNGIGLTVKQADRQIANIQSDRVLSKGASNLRVPTSGGTQTVLCLNLEYVPLWLAKISITPTMERETPEVAERLVQYQLKAKDVLAAAFIPQYANQTAKEYREETRRMEADAKQRNAALRERAAVDKRLAMYLKAKGTDKLLLLRCLRQDGIDPDIVDYVESVLRADMESGNKGRAPVKERDPVPAMIPQNAAPDYQTMLDYFLAHGAEIGIKKTVRGVDCVCVHSPKVKAILQSHNIYNRDFLKWARERGALVTDNKGYAFSIRIDAHHPPQKNICFILDKGGVSA